ncbi:hypothetical protein MMC06_001318 [Schaereria dolodes]|nr:hypothetical protein [Schaereria dolodes]
MAFTQWRNARHFVDGMNTLQRRSHLPMSPVSSTTEEAKDISNMIAQMRSLPINHWKMVHGFYCVMGGFVITNNEGKTFTINNQQLIWLLENGCVEVPDISVEGIKDKSKADSMIKAIAGLQATWFVGQGLGRWAQHLSTTTLEITTIAYVVSCVPALAFWWHKPVDVKVPTKLQVKRWSSEVTYAIRKLDPQTRQFMYMDRNEDEFPRAVNTVEIDASKGDRPDYFRGFLNWYPLVGVAMLYGLVHCIAWDFEFASAGEKWAWRVCAILTIYIAGMTAFKFSIWHIFTHSDRKERMVQSIEQVLATLYVCARVYLFIEVFLAFRSQPAGVYQSVNWSLYIPWEG